MFEEIAGNEPVKAYLRKAVTEGKLPQTLLFAGMEGVGKGLFTRELARVLLGSKKRLEDHPDFHWVRPEGKSGVYAIDTVRAVIEKEHAPPFEAERKVFVLEYAERMQPASANALLKTLEEPNPDTTFVLISSAPQEILPTILSRCIRISFGPVGEAEIRQVLEKRGKEGKFAKWAEGSVGKAVELAEHQELEAQREILLRILEGGSLLEVLKGIGELEKRIDEEEDPIRSNQFVEHLFSQILMWHRDQVLRTAGGRSELLFFPEKSGSGRPLEQVEKRVEQARLAYQRNMKLSVCLERIFL